MLNINFVPDDYIQNSESRRTNVIYLVLFAVVMAALGGSFATIRIRQRAVRAKEEFVNTRVTRIQQAIRQFEELQTKRKAMMKTALTTAQLLEPVPKSIVLASLTNSLPPGVSLLKLNLIQKESKRVVHAAPANKYQAARAGKTAGQAGVSREKLLETHIGIEGMAPSDLQVAAYIERLAISSLLENVALVESKERKIDDTIFREFKLTAMLKTDICLSKDDVDSIRTHAEKSVYNF
jgi:Tfp pilus assembly protein PilN